MEGKLIGLFFHSPINNLPTSIPEEKIKAMYMSLQHVYATLWEERVKIGAKETSCLLDLLTIWPASLDKSSIFMN